jgi:hypothetical protein
MYRPAAGQQPSFIDETFFGEWVEKGLEDLRLKLEKHAAFDAWCAANPQVEETP